jgi:HEAT repeat protein
MLPKDVNKKLIGHLSSKNASEAFGAIKKLTEQAGDALPYLIKAAHAENESTRVMAVVVLGEIEKEAVPAIPILLDLLNENNNQLRMTAALALVRIGDASIQPLKEYIATSEENACFWASWSLALLNSPLEEKSISSLSKVHKYSNNPLEVIAAEEALGKAIGHHLKLKGGRNN